MGERGAREPRLSKPVARSGSVGVSGRKVRCGQCVQERRPRGAGVSRCGLLPRILVGVWWRRRRQWREGTRLDWERLQLVILRINGVGCCGLLSVRVGHA